MGVFLFWVVLILLVLSTKMSGSRVEKDGGKRFVGTFEFAFAIAGERIDKVIAILKRKTKELEDKDL